MIWADWVTIGLMAAGLFFFTAGTVGLIRLPDPLSRLHALTKADNLGLLFICAAVAVHDPRPLVVLKLILVWLLVLAAGATGGHLIAKRALRGDGEDTG